LKGHLITFEGTEGAGKSTLIRHVEKRLRALGIRPVITREPGGSPVAEKIREVILAKKMDSWTELFLYEASRAEHLAQIIWPALATGKIILCDRFTDSSLAYQGMARGLPWAKVKALNHLATQGLIPKMTVFLDVDPGRGLRRAKVKTRFEKEGVRFQKKVRKGFLKAAAEDHTGRWLKISVKSQTPEELADLVMKKLTKRLKLRAGKKR
jgi:dTMP kinase